MLYCRISWNDQELIFETLNWSSHSLTHAVTAISPGALWSSYVEPVILPDKLVPCHWVIIVLLTSCENIDFEAADGDWECVNVLFK